MRSLLADHALKTVDAFCLVGGGSRVPGLEAALAHCVPTRVPARAAFDRTEAVACGACALARKLLARDAAALETACLDECA